MKYNFKDIYDRKHDRELKKLQGYLIYKITNLITNKCYIGDTYETMFNRLFTCWGGHIGCYHSDQRELYRSMRKRGLENYILEILDSKDKTEKYYIKLFNAYHNGYNRTDDGQSGGYGIKDKIAVNNGVLHKYIKPNELEYHLNSGWNKGVGNFGINALQSKITETLKKNESGIYKQGEQSNRSMSGKIKRCTELLKYLISINLEITEENYNKHRGSIGYKPGGMPQFGSYLRYKSNGFIDL